MKPRFFVIITVFAVVALASTSVAQAVGPRRNALLSGLATVVTSRTIGVFCESMLHPNVWTWSGGVIPRSVTLAQVRCDQLEALASGLRPRAKAKRDFAEALGILLSGANRASGLGEGNAWSSEATAIASCRAIQQVEEAAKLLIGVPRYSRELAVSFARYGYWNVHLLFPSFDCYPSGPMDFNLGWWPNPQPPPLPSFGYG